ncbi:MAG: YcfL family protein [Limisphaerales bacterium]
MKTIHCLGLAAVLLTAAGCSSPKSVNTVEPAQSEAVRRLVADRRVITDPSLAKRVTVVDVIEGATPDGLRRLQLTLHNPSRSRQAFNSRIEWFDPQGFQFGTPTDTSVAQVIEGGQTMTIQSVAPHPNARDFRISLLESTRDRYPRIRQES